jgi:hypothetical protein
MTQNDAGKPLKTTVQAASAEELAKKSPIAYDLYQRYLGGNKNISATAKGGGAAVAGGKASAVGNASSRGSAGGRQSSSRATDGGSQGTQGTSNAQEMLRQQLRKLRQSVDDPQLRELLDNQLRDMENVK